MSDTTEPTAHSHDNRIIAKVEDSVIEGEWEAMEQLAHEILNEADTHKTTLEKIEEINGAHVRLKCDNCGFTLEHERVRAMRDNGDPKQQHADYPDTDCTLEDIHYEAFCPRHGTIPLEYDECDSCASTRDMMNR